MIRGTTKLIAHIGYPTESFRAPMTFNPYFEKHGIDAVVVPMGCTSENYPAFLELVFRLSNIGGALITMPHKVATVGLLDEVMTTAKVAGSCNAVRLGPDGRLVGDMFDGEGFVRGVLRKGRALAGARALVVGSGGVGSAIAASLAKAGVAELGVFDVHAPRMQGLADRLRAHYPRHRGADGLERPRRLRSRRQRHPALHAGGRSAADGRRAHRARDVCRRGGDAAGDHAVPRRGACSRLRLPGRHRHALFEQIPPTFEFFGLRTTTADELREVARISY